MASPYRLLQISTCESLFMDSYVCKCAHVYISSGIPMLKDNKHHSVCICPCMCVCVPYQKCERWECMWCSTDLSAWVCLLSTWVYFLNTSHIGEHPLVDSQSIDPRCSICFIGVCFVTSWKPVLKTSEIKSLTDAVIQCWESMVRVRMTKVVPSLLMFILCLLLSLSLSLSLIAVDWGLDWGMTDMGGQQIWHHLLITLNLFQHKKH